MAGIFDNSFKDNIYNLLNELGNDMTIQVPSSTYIDPVTKKKVTKYKSYTGVAVLSSYSEQAIGAYNTVIKAGDVEFRCLLDDESFEPSENKSEIILFGANKYSVIHVKQVAPQGDVTVLWSIQGRKLS